MAEANALPEQQAKFARIESVPGGGDPKIADTIRVVLLI